MKFLKILFLSLCLFSFSTFNVFSHENEFWFHHGIQQLDVPKLKHEIYTISKNLGVKYTKNLSDLIIETLIVETNLGSGNYLKKDHKTKNYGIGQFSLPTVRHILKIQKSKPSSYNYLMSLYNDKLSLKENVRKNVKFTLALQILYYTMCDSKINDHISTKHERAKIWKKHYNTVKGSGTISNYLASIKRKNF